MTVDYAKLALLAGKTNDAAFKAQIDVAVSSLERLLGYTLTATVEAEERTFNWTDTLWHRVHPMYAAPTSVILLQGDNQTEETLEVASLQLGQNGKLYGDWFNAFKLCDDCLRRCRLCGNCMYVKVTAKWGFAEPTGEGENQVITLPSDLMGVIVAAYKDVNNSKKDIQSEGTGTRNYSKFAKAYTDWWTANDSVINFYKLREPRI